MKSILVPCSKCQGHGEHPLSKYLLDVYRDVKRHPRSCSKDVHGRIRSNGVEVTAINNRLTALVEMNLLTREKLGKYYLYSAAK